MPDLSMCMNEDCKSRFNCYRFTANPDEYYQVYSKFEVKRDELKCHSFLDKREYGKQKED